MEGKNGSTCQDKFFIVESSKIIQTNIHEMIQIFNICLSC